MVNQGDFELRKFDPAVASDAELRAAHAFLNETHRQLWPEDPANSFEDYLQDELAGPPSERVFEWMVSRPSDKQLVAHAALFIWHGEANQHIANFSLNVLPRFRRRSLGTWLLEPAADTAAKNGRTLLQGWTTSDAPDGDAFMQRIGATMVSEESISKLKLSEINRDLIGSWIDRASGLADEFELDFWEGAYPEGELEAIAKLKEVIDNSMPRDDSAQEDDIVTVERLREWEGMLAKRQMERWSAYVRERDTGRFAGYTEVMWRLSQPEMLHQWDTGVVHEFRNRGIGRWLKAAMIEKVQRDRPGVIEVRTGNAASNASMLRINHEMGFKPYQTTYTWQIALDKVFDYLSSREGAVDADR